MERAPDADLPGGFAPLGRLGGLYRYEDAGRLTGVQEVQVGDASYSSGTGTLTVKARVTWHRLRAGNVINPVTDTKWATTPNMRLKYERQNPDGSWITPVVSPATSTVNGIATFSLPVLNGASGVCRFTAWQDVVGNTAGVLDVGIEPWAAYDYPLNTGSNLPVVELTTTVDVGDDKNTAATKRAKIQATRSFATGNSLVVSVTLHSGVFFRPELPLQDDLAATYGTTGTADYYIISGSGTWQVTSAYTDNPVTATITIPAGQTVGEVQVVTRADNLTEQNLLVCRLATATPTPTYAPGVSTEARVLLFDGPLWTLTPLGMDYSSDYQTQYSLAYAINEVFGANQPKISGYGSWVHTSGGTSYGGGQWPLPGLSFASYENTPFYGISTDPVKLVGSLGGYARLKPLVGAGVNLPHLPLVNGSAGAGPSGAWGISPNGTYTAGFSTTQGGVDRPVVWTGTGNPFDLVGSGATYVSATGTARAVNNAQVVVGSVTGRYGTGSVTRGFRTPPGAFQALGDGDDLPPPSDKSASSPTASAGLDSGGNAIGTYINPISGNTFAIFWSARSSSANPAATHLDVWRSSINQSLFDAQSFATSISASGITGKSRTAGGADRAVFRYAHDTPWIDLGDRHYVHGTTGWIFSEATALNNTSILVGNGTFNGSNRGFILIPRTSGN